MAEGVNVDLGALTTFATTTATIADGTGASGAGVSTVFDALGEAMQRTTQMGSAEFLEAQDFTTHHAAMVTSATQLMADVMNGLGCLSAGAETCAIRYGDTDAMNAAAQRRQHSEGEGRFTAMTMQFGGSARIPADAVDAAFNPASTAQALPLLNPAALRAGGGTAPAPQAGPPLTAAQKAQQEQAAEKAATDAKAAYDQQVKKDQATLANGGTIDNGAGDGSTTLGAAPYTITVPASSAPMTAMQKLSLTPPATGN